MRIVWNGALSRFSTCCLGPWCFECQTFMEGLALSMIMFSLEDHEFVGSKVVQKGFIDVSDAP